MSALIVPARPTYGPMELALFDFYQNPDDYLAKTGRTAPPHDPARGVFKRWIDPHAGDPAFYGKTLNLGGTLVSYTKLTVTYQAVADFEPDDPQATRPVPVAQPLILTQAEAATVNFPPPGASEPWTEEAVPIRQLQTNERFWYYGLGGIQDSAVQVINIDQWRAAGLGPLPWEPQATVPAPDPAGQALLEQIAEDVKAIRKAMNI